MNQLWKFSHQILPEAGGAVENFIDIVTPGVLGRYDNLLSFAGVYILPEAGLDAIDLVTKSGRRVAAELHAPSPVMKDKHPRLDHAGHARYWIRDIPKADLMQGVVVEAQGKGGAPFTIARITLEPVREIITSSTRTPTKLSALRFLRDNGLPVATIIDVGVQHMTKDLVEVFPKKKHVLVEPVQEHYEEIERNYAHIDHQLIRAAASDSDGEGEIEVKTLRPQAGTFTSSLVVGDEHRGGFIPTVGRRKIEMVTLDRLAAENAWARPFLLKIDVDGHELGVLRGAADLLKYASCVVIEVSVANLVERATYLQNAGLVLWEIVDLGYYRDNMFLADLIFVSKQVKQTPAFDPFRRTELDPKKIKMFLH